MAPGDVLTEILMAIFYDSVPGKAVKSGGHSSRLGIRLSGFSGDHSVLGERESLVSLVYQPLASPPKQTCILN